MKGVSFVIGEEMQEDEIAEDAFQHDYSTSLHDDHAEIEDPGAYSYDTEEPWDDMERMLADRLENQVTIITILI